MEDDKKAENEEIELEVVGDGVEVEEVEVAVVEGIDYNDYPYGQPSDWSCITDVCSRLGPRYDKHGREIPELRSFHNLELGSLSPYIKEENDIDARLATLDKKLMIHNFINLTLESLEGKDERMEGNESEYLPQQNKEEVEKNEARMDIQDERRS